ncbi:MAG: formyltransferase family protein [Bdellovibrionia bacterium]
MRVVLFVSRLTFVPNNYHDFLKPLIASPHVVAVVTVDNLNWSFKLKAYALCLTGFASRLGFQLLENMNPKYLKEKQTLCEAHGKKMILTENPHELEVLQTLKELKPDYFVNARTRTFFRKTLLSLPSKKSLNIHHGLLPDQRGLMCDFWGLHNNEPSGFTIHEMTSQLDAGRIYFKQVTTPHLDGYLKQTQSSAAQEAQAVIKILEQIEAGYEGHPNAKTSSTRYYSNPGLGDFLRFYLKGQKF